MKKNANITTEDCLHLKFKKHTNHYLSKQMET